MATVKVYNAEGQAGSNLELDDAVFGVTGKLDIVHQVYVATQANMRQTIAHTKDKSEVRGGGKKPWKQKGTGRARHGSIRSPIWKGGGVTFGPRNVRNFKQKVNQKMRQLATRIALSAKVSDEKLLVVDPLESTGKTKEMHNLLSKLPGTGKSMIVVVPPTPPSLLQCMVNGKI